MSEVEALLGLYGAIDRAVEDGHVPFENLTPFLGAYHDGAATGWYRHQYLPWSRSVMEKAAEARERDPLRLQVEPARISDQLRQVRLRDLEVPERFVERDDDPVESPELPGYAQDVYDALRAFPPEPVEGRAIARRILAVVVAAAAMPRHFGPDGSHRDAARAALVFRYDEYPDGTYAPMDLAARVHDLVLSEFTSMDRWEGLVLDGVDSGTLPQAMSAQAPVPPCTGKLTTAPNPKDKRDKDPVTVLKSSFTTDAITFEAAKSYLVPSNWQYKGSFWCTMKQTKKYPGTPYRVAYHEVVATSCPANQAFWSVGTDLDFWMYHPSKTEAYVEYDLAPTVNKKTADINFDAGTLTVKKLAGDQVRVSTVKWVRFANNFNGAGLAMFMCATGYASAVEDVVLAIGSKAMGSSTTKPAKFPVKFP